MQYPSRGTRFAVGKPSVAAALVAVLDRAVDDERRPEQRAGVLERAARDEAADVARADDLAVDLEQRDDARLEAPVRAQQLRVALRAVAEAEVLADADERRAEPLDEHLVDELLRALRRERRVELDHDELLDAERGDELGLALERRQQPRLVPGRDDRGRVRVEGQHRVGARDHLAVPEVDAVERADGDAPRARLGLVRAR